MFRKVFLKMKNGKGRLTKEQKERAKEVGLTKVIEESILATYECSRIGCDYKSEYVKGLKIGCPKCNRKLKEVE